MAGQSRVFSFPMDADELAATATAKFRQAAPYAILNVAPRLAAIYTSSARLRSPACTFPDSCVKCGTYQFDGSSSIRVLRVRGLNVKNPEKRVLRRTCMICGYNDDVEVQPESEIKNSSSVGYRQSVLEAPEPVEVESRNSGTEPSVSSSSLHEVLPCSLNVRPTIPETNRSHHRGKHIKSDLRELLSRNKRRKAHQADSAKNDLAVFLNNL